MSLPQFETNETPSLNQGKRTILFDFQRGDILIKNKAIQTSEGKEAIKNKIQKFIYTDKRVTQIYKGTNYGIERENIIGKVYESKVSEIENLTAALKKMINETYGVISLDNLVTKMENDVLIINFQVATIYGLLGGETSWKV